ncbi:hypothetical protein CPB85DRAFT_667932 [Mucidula mucida]|nr:hypothetical protein CPB85DRAFT_667932 [Mucidula mucida]
MSNNQTGLPTAGLRSALSRTIPLLPIIAMCSKRAAVQAPGARSSKRKRLSCSYGELQQALSFLVSFRRKLDTVPDSTGAETTGDDTAIDMDEEEFDKLDTLVASLTARSSGLETEPTLDDLNIVEKLPLSIYPYEALLTRANNLRSVGGEHFMSASNMYGQLNMLTDLLVLDSEASARAYVDVIIYRAAALLPNQKHMIINTEYRNKSPSSHDATLNGFLDYTLTVTDNPTMAVQARSGKKISAPVLSIFVVEAIVMSTILSGFIPQAVGQLYASAIKLGQRHIRGALTNGVEWIFIILSVNEDGIGASYRTSVAIRFTLKFALDIEPPMPDVIAGMLTYWLDHCSEDIGNDDWFISTSEVQG